MSTYMVEVESVVSETIQVEANSEQEAIDSYYNGDYIMADEHRREVIDIKAMEVA